MVGAVGGRQRTGRRGRGGKKKGWVGLGWGEVRGDAAHKKNTRKCKKTPWGCCPRVVVHERGAAKTPDAARARRAAPSHDRHALLEACKRRVGGRLGCHLRLLGLVRQFGVHQGGHPGVARGDLLLLLRGGLLLWECGEVERR